jgi:hypothetical protein
VVKAIKDIDRPELCPTCWAQEDRQLPNSGATHVWKTELWEHIAHEPIEIRSKRHLKEECKKRGLIAKGYM